MSDKVNAWGEVVKSEGHVCINGMLFKRVLVPGEFDVIVHELGGGHVEVHASQTRAYVPVDAVDPQWLADELAKPPERLTRYQEEQKRLLNAERAARRAKTRVRRLVKSMGCDSLLTLTYRANMTDEATCKAHLKEFVRRLRRLIPGFAYVAAFETQKRGAWHVHLATHALPAALQWSGVKVKSFSVVRAVWRSVTGDLGGNIDQQRRKRWSGHSCAKLAAYLSKYMVKAFQDGDDWSNRFSASAHSMPVASRLKFQGSSLRECIQFAYSTVGGGVFSPFLSPYGDSFFLSIEGALPIDSGG